jgi:uncharacterized alkaline shock family protein YloU
MEKIMANNASTVPATTVTPTTATVLGAPTGKTTIVDPVVAKIAGIAAREVPGVFALGGGAARLVGAVRDVIGSTDLSQGVKVEDGEYPQPLQSVAGAVRAAVARAITELVGMEVAEINVTVSDVHIPGDDDSDDTVAEPARVQ